MKMAASLLRLLVILMEACLKAVTLLSPNYRDHVRMLSQAEFKHAGFELASSCCARFKLKMKYAH